MRPDPLLRSANIHVTGTVQGVGFRPFVYRIAKRNLLCGWVLNASDGVHIHVEGEESLVASFLQDLEFEAPSASHISGIEVEDVPLEGFSKFEIRESEHGDDGNRKTRISPDLATCPDCLQELFDPSDRRYHYPFVNCTNCGPRFTIIDALPYDRPSTSMGEFDMCPRCSIEYADPMDRRFHAQPDACFECGPELSLTIAGGGTVHARDDDGTHIGEKLTEARRKRSDELLQSVADLLRDGKIVAIKGLGGYHLACNATDEKAVATLRKRKRRYGKPLAIMAHDADEAGLYCRVGSIERELMESPASPIVLLERLPKGNGDGDGDDGGGIAPSVAGTLHELGVMLPYTPVQHLLMSLVDFPLVMTSGNFSEEPIISDNDTAHALLDGVCDAFLDNDRKIVSRYDDSVVRVIDGKVQFVRRARGYAPSPIAFPDFGDEGSGISMPALLGTGPQLKNTFALVAGGKKPETGREALVSQHVGDLENAETMDSWQQTLELYEEMFGIEPELIACDMHPEYLATKWAHAHAETGHERRDIAAQGGHGPSESGMPADEGTSGPDLLEVQHHHAHIAAMLGENIASGRCAKDETVLGVSFDGTGYGDDGTIWGGEVLLCDCAGYERIAHLQQMTIAGGDQAIRHPSRLAYALLLRDGLVDHPGARGLIDALEPEAQVLLPQMVERGINCVQTSSTGRFLDAMSALLGICTDASFDGEAPMLLEAAAYDQETGELVEDPDPMAQERYAMQVVAAAGTDAGGADGRASTGDAGGAASSDGSCVQILTSQTVRAVLDDIEAGTGIALISKRIHIALADAAANACIEARRRPVPASHGSNPPSKVALSGGVFMNRIVFSRTVERLEQEGFTVLLSQELPPNDGCISYGQIVVAAARARL